MADANIIGGLGGGILIGTAAALLLALNGRIAGISGIVGGLLIRAPKGERGWRLAFLLGLVAGAAVYSRLYGTPPLHLSGNVAVLAAAGLLVGFGTQLGSGCTSGHGVCGIARLSPRSFAATATFMVFGLLTVFVWRHLL
jgi:uncharacterized membrane protein YedE/YeeE